MVVDLVQRQIAPVADHLIGQLAEPGFDDLRVLLTIGERVRLGELQAQVGGGHAAQSPFAHGFTGVVELARLQRIGLGPGGHHVQRAIELFRTTVAHVLHHDFADATLKGGDVLGRITERFFGYRIERCACLVRTLVLAAEHQLVGVGLWNGFTTEAVIASLDFFDRGVIALGWNQCGGCARGPGHR